MRRTQTNQTRTRPCPIWISCYKIIILTHVPAANQPILGVSLCTVYRYDWNASAYHRAGAVHHLSPAPSITLPANPAENGAGTAENIIEQLLSNSRKKKRQRLAADLHDDAGPLLATARLYLNENLVNQDKATQLQSIFQARQIIDDTIQLVRNISHSLMPPTLKNFRSGISHQ